MRLHLRLVLLTGLALLLCACVDLTVVGQFAKSSLEVGEGFKSVMAEGLTSCEETNKMRGPDVEDCAKLFGPGAQDPLNKVNETLFAYIASLGKLSGVSVTGFNSDAIAADLKTAGASSDIQTKATAASGLGTVIEKVLAGSYEQAKLSKIIGEQNASVGKVVSFLHDYAADKYLREFSNQKTVIANFCAAERDRHANEPLALLLFARACRDEEAAANRRMEAVRKYREALRAVESGHKKLAESRTKWSLPELAKMLGPEIQQLNDAAGKLKAAF